MEIIVFSTVPSLYRKVHVSGIVYTLYVVDCGYIQNLRIFCKIRICTEVTGCLLLLLLLLLLLTAIGLSPGGSTQLHTNNTYYKTIKMHSQHNKNTQNK